MSARRLHLALALILIIQIALGIGWIAVIPLWQGHETDFFTVTRFLAQHGRLPTVEDYPPGAADTAQVTQPPLYFLIAAPVVAAFDSGAPLHGAVNPLPLCLGGEAGAVLARGWLPTAEENFPPPSAAAAGYGLRLLNLALGAVAIIFTFATARVLFPAHPALALTGAALLAFEPSTLRMITFISNDTLLLTLAAINLYCAARLICRQPIRWRWAAALFVLAALAVLTRLAGWAVLALNVLLLLALALRLIGRALRQRGGRRQAWIAFSVIGALAAGIALIAVFNLAASGSIFGRYSFLDERVGRALRAFDFSPLIAMTVLERTRLAFLEPFDLLSPRRAISFVYVLLPLILLGGALAALMTAGLNRLRRRAAPWLKPLLLLWAAFLIAAGLVWFRNVTDVAAYGGVTEYNSAGVFAPIRYYAPGLPAFALLLAAGGLALMHWAAQGLGRLAPRAGSSLARRAWLPPAALAGAWMSVALLGTITIVRAVPVVPAYTISEFAALSAITPVENSAGDPGLPRLLGFKAEPGAGAGLTRLTLYATLDEPGTSALGRVRVNSSASAGSFCEFVPGRGALPLPIWEPGTIYALELDVPNCGVAAGAALDLSLEWQRANDDGQLTGEPSAPVLLGSLAAPEQIAANCPAVLGWIGGYRAVKYTGPESVQAGEVLQPSLDWIIEQPSPEAAQRAYTFTHETTGQTFTCTRMDGSLAEWTRGTYRYFDRCVFTFPADAPPGVYQVSVALLNASGAPLPAAGPGGEPLADGQVPVGQVRLYALSTP